jgi:hypothetical protein
MFAHLPKESLPFYSKIYDNMVKLMKKLIERADHVSVRIPSVCLCQCRCLCLLLAVWLCLCLCLCLSPCLSLPPLVLLSVSVARETNCLLALSPLSSPSLSSSHSLRLCSSLPHSSCFLSGCCSGHRACACLSLPKGELRSSWLILYTYSPPVA